MPFRVAARSQAWVCGRSLAGIVVSYPSGSWISIASECCVLSSSGLCIGLITCPDESTECGVSECDRRASIKRRSCPTGVCCALEKKNHIRTHPLFTNLSFYVVIHYLFHTADVIVSYLFIYLLALYFADKFINYSFYLIN